MRLKQKRGRSGIQMEREWDEKEKEKQGWDDKVQSIKDEIRMNNRYKERMRVINMKTQEQDETYKLGQDDNKT